MSIFDEIEATSSGQICSCPLCRNCLTKKEKCNGFGYQFYCPDCGRYIIGDTAVSDETARDNLNNSPEIRFMLAKQLQSRKDKNLIAGISSFSLQSGVISFERK